MEHRLIHGGEQFLPFARSCITKLKGLGIPYASQSFEVDGTSIKVRITPGHEYISLSARPRGSYQFFTTGPAVETQDGAYRGHSLTVAAVRDKDSAGGYKLKATPISSTLRADEQDPPRWYFEPDAEAAGDKGPIKYVWQRQAVVEHQYFAKSPTGTHPLGVAPTPMLANSWCQATPLLALGVLGSSFAPPPAAFDYRYDLPPGLFPSGKGVAKAGAFTDIDKDDIGPALTAGVAPDADWYKRGAFTKVTHPKYGERIFIILTDVSNRFYVYPPDADLSYSLKVAADSAWPGQAAKTYIPDRFVRKSAAPLPAWCRTSSTQSRAMYQDDLSTGLAREEIWPYSYLRRKPQYVWEFNSTGTKACAIVYEDIPGIPNGPNGIVPVRIDGANGDEITDIRESLPGLVEVGLHITITGPKPEDFTFSMTLDREMRPTVTKEYVMAANYAWVVKDGDTAYTALDDLILLTGGIYYTHADRNNVPPGFRLNMNVFRGVVRVRNHTQGKTLRTFLTNDTNQHHMVPVLDADDSYSKEGWPLPHFEALGVILAYDLRILAFVVQQRLIVQEIDELDPYMSEYRLQGVYKATQRVQVYAHNALVQETLMDPESPLNLQLAEVFADTDTDDLFMLPPDEVGVYRLGLDFQDDRLYPPTAYRSLDIMRASFDVRNAAQYAYGRYRYDFGVYGASINAGAFLYFTKIANALRPNANEVFSVHPCGSWSVATSPIYYYGGEGSDLLAKYPWKWNGTQDEQIDPALMKQMLVDIISIRVKGEDGTFQDVRGTHLDCVNEAFATTWTQQDFMREFYLEEETVYPGGPVRNFNRYLVAASQTPAATDKHLVYRHWAHVSGTEVTGAGNPVYLDTRAGDAFSNTILNGAVLRGASLFY